MIQGFRTCVLLGIAAVALAACTVDKQPEAQLGDTAAAALSSEAAVGTLADDCHVGEPGDDGYCTEECPCDIGEADCDSSDECLDGLRCTFNVGTEFGYADPGTDVCACPGEERLGTSTYCSALCACDEGEGDCDDDTECASGLTCYRNAGASFGQDPDTDVCASCLPSSANGTVDYCNPGCPCDEAEGDCDDDSDCATGLECYSNVGTEFGFSDPDLDLCLSCPPDSRNGSGEFCTEDCPCEAGQGDCDSDDDCEGDLVCGDDNGAEFGLDPDDDVCIPAGP
ncbi:MAG: hypothetical protein Tsb0020_15690 [Haliangiales bacterium]